jgi:hypothetical protein
MERINKVALISKATWLAAGEFLRVLLPQPVVSSYHQNSLAV